MQRVSVNGALSDTTDVTYGVPQGSVLGPILFLLYINDINENIQSSIRLLVQQPSRHFSLNLAKIPPNQVIADFGRGSSVESESEWCPAGIIERFELFKMASKMATPH